MLQLAQLWSFLLSLVAGNGSILDPNGSLKPTAGSSSDNGSGLDPNG